MKQKAYKETRCKVCGRPIVYGINGAMMYDTCFDCRPISHCIAPSRKRNTDWDELDAMEDRCLKEVE